MLLNIICPDNVHRWFKLDIKMNIMSLVGFFFFSNIFLMNLHGITSLRDWKSHVLVIWFPAFIEEKFLPLNFLWCDWIIYQIQQSIRNMCLYTSDSYFYLCWLLFVIFGYGYWLFLIFYAPLNRQEFFVTSLSN